MLKKLPLILCFLIPAAVVRAQGTLGGEWSAGVRVGGNLGLSLKHHARSNKSALELLTAFKSFDNTSEIDGFTVSVLYQRLAPLAGKGRVSALLGVGLSGNFKDETNIGPSVMLGFDWRWRTLPIVLQLDWMPTWYLIGDSYFTGVNGALTLRYVLNRRRSQ